MVGFIALTLRLRRCQMFSIGFISGELPGQLSKGMFFSLRNTEYPFRRMARSSVLHINAIAVREPFSHLGKQPGLQHFNVLVLAHDSIHDVQSAWSLSRDSSPNHNGSGMLDGFRNTFWKKTFVASSSNEQ